MYKSPDVIKVKINVKEVFANYTASCPEDEFLQWQFTVPCAGTDEYRQVANTYTGLGLGFQCYSTLNP